MSCTFESRSLQSLNAILPNVKMTYGYSCQKMKYVGRKVIRNVLNIAFNILSVMGPEKKMLLQFFKYFLRRNFPALL